MKLEMDDHHDVHAYCMHATMQLYITVLVDS